ncbi:MAG TPA: hypothetical protein VG266_08030 [Candidatus Dormibacteraeota bacterium]|nr:hypothetical protein [Candidatus Dormibacteraeota bacterium]
MTGPGAGLLRRLADPPHYEEMAPPVGGGAGPAGNARLTALTGSLLLIPLALVFGSGIIFSQLRTVHFFVGFLLIPLVALKLASTGWRVLRYYVVDRRDGGYRRVGPPWWLPRALAPLVAASAVVALLSGVILWVDRTQRGLWSTVHTDSVVVLAVSVGVHLLLRAWRTTWETGVEVGRITAPRLPGRSARAAVLVAVLLCGAVVGGVLTARTDWPAQLAGPREGR